MTKPTILLVDYDPASIESILTPLTRAGYDVSVAKNGPAGLEAFRRVEPDLVLTQMMLPKIAGLDLCREIRKSHPAGRPPILVFDTSPNEKGRPQAIAAGANGYIVAPIPPDTLVDTCNEYLMGMSVELLDFTPREEGSGGDPSQAVPAAEGDAAAAAEILKQLDALLPSKPMEFEETPGEEATQAVASPASGNPEEQLLPPAEGQRPAPAAYSPSSLPSPVPTESATRAVAPVEQPAPQQVIARPAPTASEPKPPRAVARRLPAAVEPGVARAKSHPIPRPGPTRKKSPWPMAFASMALVTGLIAAIFYGWGRTRPGPEPPAREISGVDRPLESRTTTLAAEAPEDSRPATEPSSDGRGEAVTASGPGGGSPERRSALPGDGSRTAVGTRLEPPRDAPTSSAAAATGRSPERLADTTSVPVEPKAVLPPAPPPVEVPAPVAAGADAAPRSNETVGESSTPLATESPASAAPGRPDTEVATPEVPVRPGDFVEPGDVDVPPVIKTRTQPDYPERALRMRQSGTVVLGILVDETGKVTEVASQDGSVRRDFLAAATRAVRSWTYGPATKNGVPVKTRITVRIDFRFKP